MENKLFLSFNADLQKLIGKECWGIVQSSGSYISFDFGGKIPRKVPVDNENLSEDVRNFESEYSFFILCVWRIDSQNEVIFGSWTEYEIVKENINDIIGQKITKIELSEPAFDLSITFSNNLKLVIFCDQTNVEDSNDNYNFFTPEIIYTVGHKSILTKTNYDKT